VIKRTDESIPGSLEAGMTAPDEEVAARIFEKIREAELLTETGLKKLRLDLVAGKLKAEDWRFIFETYRSGAEDADAPQSQ
jgi:hypothetical protein